jgi:hypothetical protein
MYSSTSLPGFSGGAGCYHCHNDPVYVYNDSGNLPAWNATKQWPETSWFSARQDFSINYVPVVSVTEASLEENLGFVKIIFATNASHFTTLIRVDFDPFINASDGFALVFNIDSTNFSMGMFMDNSLMKTQNGNADLWVWKNSDVGANGTGLADDQNIDTTYHQSDASQDVTVAASYGVVGFGGGKGYYLQFTRARDTGDANDVVFGDNAVIAFGIAYWNGTSGNAHQSSFDKLLVIGDQSAFDKPVTVNPYVTVTETQAKETVTTTETILDEDTVTITTGTASAFTAILVVVTVIAIPVIFRLRRK